MPAVLVLSLSSWAWSQNPDAVAPANMSAAQIVERMRLHDKAQADALENYRTLRHYEVEYRGFFRKLSAKMDVEVTYDPSSGKSFRIVSQSGSHALCDHVLKRAVDSEKEAAVNKAATALTPANYKFRLLGSGELAGRPVYSLNVEPVTPNKFLYKGTIWVDAADFAPVKLEVQPAQNPSFWISRTLVHNTYARTNGFWLPEHNRSETKVRIGGTAVFTIDYGNYQFTPKQVSTAANETH